MGNIKNSISEWQSKKPEPFSNRNEPFKRGRLQDVMEFLRPSVRIVDIGSGTGHTMAYLENEGKVTYGLSLTREEVDKKVCSGQIEVADIQTYESPQKFDAAIMWDVIEHLAAPVVALSQVNKLLNLEGRFIAYIPGEDWQECDYHTIVPTKRQVLWLANLSGFEVTKTWRNRKSKGIVYYMIKRSDKQLYPGKKA